jgi:riboflavin biosynthesis pyrimidine reductase
VWDGLLRALGWRKRANRLMLEGGGFLLTQSAYRLLLER